MKEQRQHWHEHFKDIDPKRLVFIDESGAKTLTHQLSDPPPTHRGGYQFSQ